MFADKIANFFIEFEGAWDAIPGYIKVFIYSCASSMFGLWVLGELTWQAVVVIVATNIGIYQGPRMAGKQVKKII